MRLKNTRSIAISAGRYSRTIWPSAEEDAAQAIAVLAARADAAPLDGRRAVADDVDDAEARDLRARIDPENPHGSHNMFERRWLKRGRRPRAHEHSRANVADRLSGMSHQCSAADHAGQPLSAANSNNSDGGPQATRGYDTGRARASVSG